MLLRVMFHLVHHQNSFSLSRVSSGTPTKNPSVLQGFPHMLFHQIRFISSLEPRQRVPKELFCAYTRITKNHGVFQCFSYYFDYFSEDLWFNFLFL